MPKFSNIRRLFADYLLTNLPIICQQFINNLPTISQHFVNNLTKIYQQFAEKFDNNLTIIWQQFDHNLTWIWQQFFNNLTTIFQQISNYLPKKNILRYSKFWKRNFNINQWFDSYATMHKFYVCLFFILIKWPKAGGYFEENS